MRRANSFSSLDKLKGRYYTSQAMNTRPNILPVRTLAEVDRVYSALGELDQHHEHPMTFQEYYGGNYPEEVQRAIELGAVDPVSTLFTTRSVVYEIPAENGRVNGYVHAHRANENSAVDPEVTGGVDIELYQTGWDRDFIASLSTRLHPGRRWGATMETELTNRCAQSLGRAALIMNMWNRLELPDAPLRVRRDLVGQYDMHLSQVVFVDPGSPKETGLLEAITRFRTDVLPEHLAKSI